MKNILVLVMVFACCSNAFADEIWEPVPGIKEPYIKEIAIDQFSKGRVYAASLKTLYRTEDMGNTWRAVFSAKADSNAINFISVSRHGVFLCTEKGLFNSIDGKSRWKRVFKGVGTEQNNVLHIAFSKDRVYLGTRGGLFTSSDNGATWQKDSGEAGNISVKWTAFSGGDIFLATQKGAYKGSSANWRRVFITSTEEIEYDAQSQDVAVSAVKSVNSIFIKDNDVYLATDSGLFISEDKGESWQDFESTGLGSEKINRILFKDNLYAATDKGVFVFLDKTKMWKALYKGMEADKARDIALDDRGIIWVATNKGVYNSNSRPGLNPADSDGRGDQEDILGLFSNEPTIREVQNVAIEYAEVYPEKIANWRRHASLKPLLPEFSLDYDKTVNYDSGADRYYVGPYDWGASVKWDLGEIIWNPSQTSIDVRSKLMVQLRDDILDEVTRTYFERRRLQLEAYLSPPLDLREKLEEELRIQELTADLDALTGGYFSEQLK